MKSSVAKQFIAEFLFAVLSGCVSVPAHRDYAAPVPAFDPIAFFKGHTIGEGTLAIAFSGKTHTHVVGDGRITDDGTLVLKQRVEEGTKPPRTRVWRIHRTTSGTYAGTLTDATAPVTASVAGNRLRIGFTMEHGLKVVQWLYLQPGGSTAINRMVVTKFGLPIASLRETIVRRN